MTPTESAMLVRLADDLRVVKATVMAQAMFGARPWAAMAVALVGAVVTVGGVLRVEYTLSRMDERLHRLEHSEKVAVVPAQ